MSRVSVVTVDKLENRKISICCENPKEENREITEIPVKYPRSVPFILLNVFLDRFSSGGILAILAIFINQKLQFNSDVSTAIFHANEFVLYFFTIVGAIVADSWLGLYKTILFFTSLFSVGASIVSVASVDLLQLPIKVLSIIGLAAVVIASGGIKTNQSVFGGNQFKLPQQESQLNHYFTIQYFVTKCGVLAGQMTIPILRNDVKCFGMDNCFPLAFGLPAILMVMATIFLCCGRKFYFHSPPTDNMFVKVCNCILTALKSKLTQPKNDTKTHWLEYAQEKCGEKLVLETKMVLNVSKLFAALPLFWAMYSQCNSRWVFQATKMNGDIGFYTIKPDQIVMLPNVFILVMLPTFDYAVYPLLAKVGIRTALQKVTCGFVCCLLSFIAAAVIESKINDDSIAMLWLFPQYFILAASEVFIWVPIINFAYTEAPDRMKSVMTSFVYVTVSMGSLIVIIVSGSKFVESQVYEFIMYAGVMVINIFFFVFMSKNYTFVGKSR